jgi:hypothetical protein
MLLQLILNTRGVWFGLVDGDAKSCLNYCRGIGLENLV